MGFGLAFVFVLVPAFILSLVVSAITLLLSGKGRRLAALRTICIMYAVGFGLFVLGVMTLASLRQILSPMKVDRSDVIGTYHIDRKMFAGHQAEWQYDHFVLEITESDSVVLRSLDVYGRWHSFTRPITPLQGVRSYLWQFPSESDTTAHHILSNTPTLHRQQWSFYYSFRSPRFGNVFFRKTE